MISKIRLRNFQKFHKLDLEFDPLVTTLIGDTNAGKSTVIRALRLILLNKSGISPDSYISWDKDSFKILLKVDDHVVGRTRGRENLYELDGEIYKSFGTGMPQAIEDLINASPNNFQRQLDPQFWLTESAGQVARNLNQIVDLEVIDSSLSKIASRIRKASLKVELIEEDLVRSKKEVESTAWAVTAHARLSAIDRLITRQTTISTKLGLFCDIRAKVVEATVELEKLNLRHARGLKCLSAAKNLQTLRDKLRAAVELRDEITLNSGLANVVLPDIAPLIAFRKKADALAEKRRNAEFLRSEIHQHQSESSRCRKKLEGLKLELNKLQSRRKKCPSCGQPLPYSPSSVPTSTSPTHPRCGVPTNRTGTKSKRDIASKLKT